MKTHCSKLLITAGMGLALSLSLGTVKALGQQSPQQPTQPTAPSTTQPPTQPTTESTTQQPAPVINDPRGLMTALGQALTMNPTQIQTFVDQLAEDVRWTMVGDRDRLLFPGSYQGRQNVQDNFIPNATRTFIWTEFNPLDVLVEQRAGGKERRVAARVAQSGTGTYTGKTFQGDFVYLFTLDADGRIKSLEGYYNTYPVAAAATGVTAPQIPANDRLTRQAATSDRSVNSEVARKAAIATWEALMTNDLQQVSRLSAPNAQWSFAIGGHDALPYAKAAQGITSDGKPLTADYRNAGPVITQILQPRANVVTPGKMTIRETLASGNRVFVHLRETGAIALETGNRYDLDILSWMTVDRNGKVISNEVIVDTAPTLAALRPGAMFPLPESPFKVRRYPPYYVTGNRVGGTVVTFDHKGNYTGILGQAASTDSQLAYPSALTYGQDGKLYVTSSDLTDRVLGNEVLVYDGVSGQYQGIFGQATNAQSQLLNPTGIKFGPDGNLYVASAFTSQILRYNGKTGAFMGVYARRNNGFPNNVVPTNDNRPDFTVLVFGPDGNLYVTSMLENAVLRYAGPKAKNPGQFMGVYGQASATGSGLNQPRSIVFGPEADLYATSAFNGQILRYTGPLSKNPGQFLGVYADVGREVVAERGVQNSDFNNDSVRDLVIQNGLGFNTEGNLFISSSIELESTSGQPGMPTGGSQVRIYAGPHKTNAGQFLGVFGQTDTDRSRILLPTTPEFVYHENSFPTAHRFDQIHFVVGCNTDRPNDATNGSMGFFQSDDTDTLAAYDQNMQFLKFLDQNLLGSQNPLDGIGGVVIAPNGRILASSQLSDQVLAFDSLTGKYVGVFGDASPQGTGDNPATSENEGLDLPTGITIGPDNNLYVSDLTHKRVLKFDGYTGKFLGVVIQLNNPENVRFTDLAFGPDGRIYIGLNPPLEQPVLGAAEVRVYRPDGTQETTIKGPTNQPFDFVAAMDIGPDNRLYIGDDSASIMNASLQTLAPGRESRIVIYDIPTTYPLIRNSKTGQGDPKGTRQEPRLVREFQIGVGNAGGLTVDTDGTIYISEPAGGQVAKYNDRGQFLGTLPNFHLPNAASSSNGGVDADGKCRPTGSIFIKSMQR